MKPLRVVQIVASIADEAAGPSYSAPRLASAQAAAGAGVEMFTVGEGPPTPVEGVVHHSFPQSFGRIPVLSGLRASNAMRAALRATDADVLHTHGLWLAPNIYPAAAARARGRLFVLSPRGMLGEAALGFSRGKKRLMWLASQGRAARSAGLLHATSGQELDDIRAFGLTNPVAVIANGIDAPPLERPAPGPLRTALSLGRIHPKKNLTGLIRAWARLDSAGWRLRIVGPDEGGHAGELWALVAQLGLANVSVEAPVFGGDKLAAYREADLFVLSTLNENFAMTVAEALAAGTPVISTKGAPWSGLETEHCGWWVDHGEEAMAAALTDAMRRAPQDLAAMGARGRDWMLRDFGWEKIGRDMLAAYRWAMEGGAPPPTVSL
jgi:glycosyltransferase involved in cell wall biosynthesis